MRSLAELRAMSARHPDATEIGTGLTAFFLVLMVSLLQWGPTVDGFVRGLSLGVALAVVAYLVPRRRRLTIERRDREVVEQRLLIARELHDTVAGTVSAIGIQAAAARRAIDSRPKEAAAALERIESASRAANLDLRRMLEALRGDRQQSTLPEPGLDGLGPLAEEARSGGADVRLIVDPAALRIADPALDHAAYRIVQEALTNVVRHAGPVPVAVDVGVAGDRLQLSIVNGPGNGPGPRGSMPGSGLGLVGMEERAALFGGALTAGPTPDGGFAVRATLPIGSPTRAGRPA
jgi:signal transduction histidine kinase